MSSEYVSSVHNLETAPLQGTQHVSPVPARQQQPAEVERNDSAARGQDLPPNTASAAEQSAKVESAVSQISDFVQNFQRDLLFSVDEDSGRIVVKVVDSETKEVIRTIPPEEMLRMAQNLDSPESLIFSEQA